MLGCASALSIRCRIDISSVSWPAPAVCTTTVDPSKRVTVRPSSLFSRSVRSVATRSISGGDAFSASASVKARLSFTASSHSVTLRPRLLARFRAYAARSSADFLAIVSSIFSPVPLTGCAAPMLVPGAIAATSAAMVMMKPADAACTPAGDTYTTTGVRLTIIRETMDRVESTRPPGVLRVKTRSEAPSASARSMASIMNSADTG